MTHFLKLFEQRVCSTKDAIAIKSAQGEDLSYAELNRRINKAANYLTSLNIKPAEGAFRIAILHHRSLDTLIMMFAAWKIGASFILLDPNDMNKQDVNAKLIARCKPNLIITSRKFQGHPQLSNGIPCCYLDKETQAAMDAAPQEFTREYNACEAYLIQTSGTTSNSGEPKIAVIEHTDPEDSGLTPIFADLGQQMNLTDEDTVLWDCPLKFDPTIFVPGMAFLAGSAIYIAEPDEVLQQRQLLERCVAKKVNIMLLVPSSAELLLPHRDVLARIKNLQMIFTGEELKIGLVKEFAGVAKKGTYNAYGPTEGPIGLTFTRLYLHIRELIDIGQPIKGRQCHIITETGALAAANQMGELIYKSDGFKGYLDDEAATEARKIQFDGEQYWRSGDIIQQTDSLWIFAGRSDKQVKILGVRIDPGSIEATLEHHFPVLKPVHTVVIKPKTPRGFPSLVSFCKIPQSQNITIEDLKNCLQSHRLIYHTIVILDDNDPGNYTTSNGKYDEAAIVRRYTDKITINHQADSILERLRAIWCFIFNNQPIQDDADFEKLGGSSSEFVQMKLMIAKDEMIQVATLDGAITEGFLKNPTLKVLTEQIEIYKSRLQRIKNHYPQRLGEPIIAIGDLSDLQIQALSNHQPVMQISRDSRNSDLVNEAFDIVAIIQLQQMQGPYYIVCADERLLAAVNDLLKKHGEVVAFIGNLDERDVVLKVAKAYLLFTAITVQNKVNKINLKNRALGDPLQQAKLGCIQQNTIIFDQNSTHIENWQKSALLVAAKQEEVGISLGADEIHSISLQNQLIQHGFSVAEFQFLRAHPIRFIISGITHPKQIHHFIQQAYDLDFPFAQYILLVAPGLYAEKEFLTDISGGKCVWVRQQTVNEIDVVETIKKAIESTRAHISEQQKNNLFHSALHYGMTLAQYMRDKDCVEINSELPLFDKLDILTDTVFRLVPIIRFESVIRFANLNIQTYFKNLELNQQSWPLPFGELRSLVPPKSLHESVVTVYHAQGHLAPLFMLPPITGKENNDELAKFFPSDQPIISFKHPRWAEPKSALNQRSFGSLTELAAYYVDIILQRYRRPSIALCGWSFGGLIAVEMARQLRAQQITVDYVGIIDTRAPSVVQALLNNPDQQRQLLFARVRWAFNTFQIPDIERFLREQDALDFSNNPKGKAKQLWDAVVNHIDSVPKHMKDCEQVKDVILLCRDHYGFTQEELNDDLQNTYLYKASLSEPNGFYDLITTKNLGWKLPDDHVFTVPECDHFTIIKKKALAGQILKELKVDLHINRAFLADHTIVEQVRNLASHLPALPTEIELDVKCRLANAEATLSISKIWQGIVIGEDSSNYILLGDAGSGKTRLGLKLYQRLAERYLSNPSQSGIRIPLYLKLRDFPENCFVKLMAELGLSEIQQQFLNQQFIVLIIDGVDEIKSEALEIALNNIPLDKDHVQFIWTCKSQYYEDNQQLANKIHGFCKPKKLKVQPLNPLQQRELIAKNKIVNSDLQSRLDQLCGSSGGCNNPMQLQLLIEMLSTFPLDPDTLEFTRASLYRKKIQSLAIQNNLSLKDLNRFAKQLAGYSYSDKQPLKTDGQYPWEMKTYDFATHLQFARYDTADFAKALMLQKTKHGYEFSHPSYREYFMALVLWDEIMLRSPVKVLNQINLCYQQDLLDFIADLYHRYIFQDAQQTSQRRHVIKSLLFCLVFSSYQEPKNKNIAANALSILANCRDIYLQLPKDYRHIHLGAVNLSGATLDYVDFTGVESNEPAVLSGASLHQAKIPDHWKVNYEILSQRQYKKLLVGEDGHLYGLEIHNNSHGNKHQGRVTLYRIGEDDQPKKTYQTVVYHNRARSRLDDIEEIIFKKELDVYAIITRYPIGCRWIEDLDPDSYIDGTDAIQYPTASIVGYRLQIFVRDKLVRNYYFGGDDKYSFRLKTIRFHPDELEIFALSVDQNKLYLFDKYRRVNCIAEFNQTLVQFVLNKVAGYVCVEQRGENAGIILIAINPPHLSKRILFRDLTREPIGTKYGVILFESFVNKPWLLFAAKKPKATSIVFIYDIDQNKILYTWYPNHYEIKSISIDPSEQLIALNVNGDVQVWQYVTGVIQSIFKIQPTVKAPEQLIFKDADTLIIRADHLVLQVKPQSSDLNYFRHAHNDNINKILIHPFEPWIYILGERTVQQWHLPSARKLHQVTFDTPKAIGGCLTKDGKHLIVGQSKTIYIYNMNLSEINKFNPRMIIEPNLYYGIRDIVRCVVSDDCMIFGTFRQFYRFNWRNGVTYPFIGPFDQYERLYNTGNSIIAFGDGGMQGHTEIWRKAHIYEQNSNEFAWRSVITFNYQQIRYVYAIAIKNKSKGMAVLAYPYIIWYENEHDQKIVDYQLSFPNESSYQKAIYSPDDRYLATAQDHRYPNHSIVGSIAFWDAENPDKPLITLFKDSNIALIAMCWPQPNLLIVGRKNGELYWYDVSQITKPTLLKTTAYQLQSFSVFPRPREVVQQDGVESAIQVKVSFS